MSTSTASPYHRLKGTGRRRRIGVWYAPDNRPPHLPREWQADPDDPDGPAVPTNRCTAALEHTE